MFVRSLTLVANRLIVFLPVSLWLFSCINLNNFPAQIDSVNKDNNKIGSSKTILSMTPIKKVSIVPLHMIRNTFASRSEKFLPYEKNKVYNRKHCKILQGSYKGTNTYVVKRGDTIFYIAWITGNNLRDLAKRNNLSKPYTLKVGQILYLDQVKKNSLNLHHNAVLITSILAKNKSRLVIMPKSKRIIISRAVLTSKNLGKQDDRKVLLDTKNNNLLSKRPPIFPSIRSSELDANNISMTNSIFSWRWPTKGKVIKYFSFREGGNKGIDIAGRKGQDIVAAADGYVVYAGNALRDYGNLIIIKHNQNYLSAYAYNDRMLVREKQQIKSGQKVATMGSTGKNSARLHFEIRYKGKSMNPMQYLPQRYY